MGVGVGSGGVWGVRGGGMGEECRGVGGGVWGV